MRASLLACALLAGCAATGPGGSTLAGTIEIRDFEPEVATLEYSWARECDFYVRGARRVPVALVEHLGRVALEAPEHFPDLPEELGITPDAVIEHEMDILDAALAWHGDIDIDLPDSLEDLLGYEAVRRTALARLVDPGQDPHESALTLLLPGDPPLELRSESESPWMQPWRVKVRGEWRTACSLEISRLVAVLVDPRGGNARLLDGTRYWAADFWRDAGVWGEAVGDALVRHHALQLGEGLAGYDTLAARYRVTEATVGWVNQQPNALFVELAATGVEPIDRLRVWNPLDEDGAPQCDWDDAVAVLAACEHALARFPALKAWKAAQADRHMGLDIAGKGGISSTDLATYVLPPWEHAGLAGHPEFELHLLFADQWVGTLFLSSHADGALLEHADAAFLEAQGRTYHPDDPRYALLRPDGAVELREAR